MKKKILAILVLAAAVPLVVALAGGGWTATDEEAAPAAREGETGGAAVELKGVAGDAVVVGAPEAAPPSEESLIAVSQTSSLPGIGPRVVKTAFMRLGVPRGRFEEVVERAELIAKAHGGFVASATASKGAGEALVRGSLVVRVPEGAYTDVMRALRRLGKVEGREESGQDVSAQFVDLQARARHLEAVEAQLLEFLDRADEVAEALAVQQQLSGVQLELEQVRGQLRYLDDQASFATISLELHELGVVAAGGGKDGGWGVVEAWRDGAEGFVRVAAGMFVGVATAAPVLLLILGALVAGRFALAHRRRVRRVDTTPVA